MDIFPGHGHRKVERAIGKFISHNVKERRKPAVSIFSGNRRHSGAKTFMDSHTSTVFQDGVAAKSTFSS
jgi:hypothetical protein